MCRKQYMREYYRKHPEKFKVNASDLDPVVREYMREYHRNYYQMRKKSRGT